jgi:vacuolar protein sorting-associated protein 13A/C
VVVSSSSTCCCHAAFNVDPAIRLCTSLQLQDVAEKENIAANAAGASSGAGMGSMVGGRLYALLDTIIGNLQLKITNVHVRYEDSSSNPGHSFCIGVMLQEISASTANEDWRAAFVTAGALLTLRKVRAVQALCDCCRACAS